MGVPAENIWASIVRFIQDEREAMNLVGTLDNAEYIEWDAHANINDLPSADLIGPRAFSVTQEDNIYIIHCAIGIATFNEENLFRLRKASARIFDKVSKNRSISVYDVDTEIEYNQMVITDGTHLAPVARADVRALQFIQFEALLEC